METAAILAIGCCGILAVLGGWISGAPGCSGSDPEGFGVDYGIGWGQGPDGARASP